jgi:secretion/DNA translocation related TadE-like protein
MAVVLIAVVVIGVVLALGAARLGGAVVGRARADAAADAAALAAADMLALGRGADAAAEAAAETAVANDARLVRCVCRVEPPPSTSRLRSRVWAGWAVPPAEGPEPRCGRSARSVAPSVRPR